jgi:hypothetical protein
MKVNFKFLTFCLITTFLAVSYQPGMPALKKKTSSKKTSSKKTGKKKTGYKPKTYSPAELRDQRIYKNVRNNSNIPTIQQGRIMAPSDGTTKTINEWLRLIQSRNRSAYFLVYDPNKKGSYSARNYGFDEAWLRENGDIRVTVGVNRNQVEIIQKNGALPTQAQINKVGTLKITSKQQAKLKTFLQTLLRRYTKLMASFKATNAKGETYDLFLADPYPGYIVTSGSRYTVPAYSKVLKSWYVTD